MSVQAKKKARKAESLECPSCGADVHTVGQHALCGKEASGSSNWGSRTQVVCCETCGAETILAEGSGTKPCPFCGSTKLANGGELPDILPESIMPFQVPEIRARQFFAKWIRRRLFAPSELKRQHHLDQLTGMFVPYWTYDAETYSPYSADRGDYHWETEQYATTENGKSVIKNRDVRRLYWQRVSGVHLESFSDILVRGSDRLSNVLHGKVARFDLEQLVDYEPEYLSGFSVEKYSIGLQDGWERASQVICESLSDSIAAEIGGDRKRSLHFQTSFEEITHRHFLLPFWISAYRYHGRLYHFVVNGQTGEVRGKSPLNPVRVIVAILVALALIDLTVFLLRAY